jgi:hypothetical protein
LLAELGWSPNQLAGAINGLLGPGCVARSTVSDWLNQDRLPREPMPTVVAHLFSDVLDREVSVAQLWSGRTQPAEFWVPADHGLQLPWTAAGSEDLRNRMVDHIDAADHLRSPASSGRCGRCLATCSSRTRALRTLRQQVHHHQARRPRRQARQLRLHAHRGGDDARSARRPRGGDRVLEIGAGTGYNAALVAGIVGNCRWCHRCLEQDTLGDATELSSLVSSAPWK